MSDPIHAIVEACVDLKSVAPNEFNRFIEAFKALELRCDADLRAAGRDVIFPAQGKAQLVAQLRNKMENCFVIRSTQEQRKQ